MFSKQNDRNGKAPSVDFSAPAPAPQPTPEKPQSVSMISEGVAVTGDIIGEGELHLDCAVRGDIRVGKLVVGQKGRVEGSIHARVVEIRGRIVGAVAAQQVRLYATASVDGDITHEQLAMETGANFQGRSLKFKRPDPVPAAAPTPVQAPVLAPAPSL